MFALDVVLMVLVAGLVLGVWPHGNALFFLVVSAFYVLISLSLGLIISATSSTAAEAVQKTVLFSVPLVQLGGFVFPIRNMPIVSSGRGALPGDALHPVSARHLPPRRRVRRQLLPELAHPRRLRRRA